MPDKYHNLSTKGPKEAAYIVGEVEKRNYLAHTIRDKVRLPFQRAYTINRISSRKTKTGHLQCGHELVKSPLRA